MKGLFPLMFPGLKKRETRKSELVELFREKCVGGIDVQFYGSPWTL